MLKTAILTDSACDIPLEVAKHLNIDIFCFDIAVDGKAYVERVDFTPEEYLSILNTCAELPTTSQITAYRIEEKYKELAAAGYDNVLHVTISSTGSATYGNACFAKRKVEEAGLPLTVYVIDSKSYSIGYGYPLCKAAELLAGGMGAEEIADYLTTQFAGTEILLGMYSLRFARKSGRIGTLAAFAGELMGLKPLVLMKDGTTETIARVRGEKALLPSLVANLKARMPSGSHYCIGYTQPAALAELLALCEKEVGYPPAMVTPLGAAVTSNAGPDSIGIVYRAG